MEGVKAHFILVGGSDKWLGRTLQAVVLAGWTGGVGAAESVAGANLEDYQKIVAPVFAKSYVDCHGPKKSKEGFRVDELDADYLSGGDVDRRVEI